MKIHRCYLAAIVLIIVSSAARGEDPATDGYVTRKEYEELKEQMLAMKKELDAVKKEKGAVSKQDVETGKRRKPDCCGCP